MMQMRALVPTVPEIRYLLARLLLKSPGKTAFVIAWSIWRRQHQAKAAEAHYQNAVKRNGVSAYSKGGFQTRRSPGGSPGMASP